MKKRLFVIIFLIAALLPGCFSNYNPDHYETVTITDATGASVSVPQNPKRVAVLFSSFSDIWLTAGGSIAITVGESIERGFTDTSVILVDDGAGKTIDTERLIASNPDFIICSADIAAQLEAAKICRQAGLAAAAFRVECFDDYLSLLACFTEITGHPDRLQQYGASVKESIETMLQQYHNRNEEASILFVRAGSSARSTKAKTSENHFVCQMLKELGTHNIAEAAPVLLDGLSFEEILIQDPAYIFITTMGDEEAAISYVTAVLQEPQWQALSAIKENRIIILPKDLFQYKPNSRWAEAYAYLINAMTN